MSMRFTRFAIYGSLAALMPTPVFAMTFIQVLGVFHMFVGVFLVAIVLTFASGVFVYFVRLGTWPTHRDTAIEVLEWAISMLFVLIVILGVVRFFESYPYLALLLFGLAVLFVVLIYLLRAFAGGGAKKKAPPAGTRPGAAPRR